MDGQHHPDAAEVLEVRYPSDGKRCCEAFDLPSDILDTLASAGLAVVRVGDVPPWMESANCVDCGCAWGQWGAHPETVGEMYVNTGRGS